MKYFKNFSEVYEDLASIKPLKKSLKEKQEIEDVMPTVQRVAINIVKASNLNLKEEEFSVYSFMLKRLGMTTYKEANPCFVTNAQSVMDITSKKGSIEFPLSAFTQFIDTPYETASYAFERMSDWMGEWLESQGITEENMDSNIKGEESTSNQFKYFTNFEEVMKDLNKVVPFEKDWSQYSPIKDVIPSTKRIMVNLLASSHYKFSPEEAKIYTDKLKALGCRNYKEVNNTFRSKGLSVGALLKMKDDIGFPISALSQFLDGSYDNFNLDLDLMAEGEEYSWIANWLDSQGVPYDKINEFVEKYDDDNLNKSHMEEEFTDEFLR